MFIRVEAFLADPFNASLASLQGSNPTLYNYLSSISWFSSKTLQAQQLLRAYPNARRALQEADGFTAKSVYNDGQLLFRKRFSKGLQSSVACTRQAARQQWQPNQFNPAIRIRGRTGSCGSRFGSCRSGEAGSG